MSGAEFQERVVASTKSCVKIVVCAPKGGVGKTSLIRGLLVSAVQRGIKAVGINFDEQQTLSRWAQARATTRLNGFPDTVEVTVWQHPIDEYRRAMSDVVGYQVAICDTPPGHGAHVNAIANLCAMADLILIPTSSSTDDLSEVVPFRSRVAGNKGVFILNKVNRRTGSFTRARTVLMQGGKLCPVEIPLYEDIHSYFDRGLTALDVDRANGSAELGLVWDFVAQECFAS